MVKKNFIQVFHREYMELITKNFKTFLDNDLYIDLMFVCKNNKKVKAHQIVFSNLSRFLNKILTDNQYDCTGKVVYICVPDITHSVMEHIIQFVYTGKTTLQSNKLKEFHEDLILLGIPSSSISTHNKQEVNMPIQRYTYSPPNYSTSSPNQCSTGQEVNSNLDTATYKVTEELANNDPCLITPVISNVYSLSDELHFVVEPKAEATVTNPGTINTTSNDEEAIQRFAKNLFVQFKKLQQKSRNSTVARKYVKRRSVNSSTAKCMLKCVRSSSENNMGQIYNKMKLRPRH